MVTNPGDADLQGYVDFYGFSSTAGGWVMTGWVGRDWDGYGQAIEAILDFDSGPLSGAATVCTFERADIKKVGVGLVVLIESGDSRPSYLTDATLIYGPQSFRLVAAQTARHMEEQQLLDRSRELISAAPRTSARAELLRGFSRSRFTGRDTLSELRPPVFLELDAVYICPPHGLLLRGWFVDPFHSVAKIRLRSGNTAQLIDPTQWIRIPRPDVEQSVGEKVGSVDRSCGFLSYTAPIALGNAEIYFEIELETGELHFKPVAAPVKTGLVAIREILSVFDLRNMELTRAFDSVAGPAIASLNRQRLRTQPRIDRIDYGSPPDIPRTSIIVPLYGRMDFIEYQLAFFYRTLAPDHELIYVLDDPDRKRELEALAAACYAKFSRSFTILMLSHNMGYAPANNIGLRYARADFTCFLNSDVFPRTPDWIEQLLRTAEQPGIGVTGALLVFEDGTIQHEGIEYDALQEFGGWIFSLHPRKGRYPVDLDTTGEVEAVTGACLLMRTDLAREIGGFDEGYIIGDFEDVDLCKRIKAQGLRCAVNRRAQLYHLERQSQGDQQLVWRTNLTLFNAWRFQRKWATQTEAV